MESKRYHREDGTLLMIHDYKHGNRQYYNEKEELEAVHYYKNGKRDGLRLEEKRVEYWNGNSMAWWLPISEFLGHYREELEIFSAPVLHAAVCNSFNCCSAVNAIHECVELHHENGQILSFETETLPHLFQ